MVPHPSNPTPAAPDDADALNAPAASHTAPGRDDPHNAAPAVPDWPPRHSLADAEWADPRDRRTTRIPRPARDESAYHAALCGEPATSPSPSASSAALRVESGALFTPTPDQLHQVLSDLVCPYASLDDVAKNNGTTVYALSAWMALAETQTMLDQIEQAAYRRARVSAACNLTDAVNSLSFTLRAHVSAETNEPLGRSTEALNIRQRQRTDARKASWLLFRIARAYPAIPIDPNTLRFINTLKRERDEQRERVEPSERASPHEREHFRERDERGFRDELRERAERCEVRVPLVPAERSEVEPVPTITSSTHRVACLHEVQACSDDLTHSPAHANSHGCAVGGEAMSPGHAEASSSPLSIAHSPLPSPPHSSAFNSSSCPSRSSRSTSSPPLRNSESSAHSAFSSQRARDHPPP